MDSRLTPKTLPESSMYSHAIVRKPGVDFAQGITTSTLGIPDYSRMLEQHIAYTQTFRKLGLHVNILEPLPGFPDAYFVEDPAVVLPELAVLTFPGAKSRQGEQKAIEPILARYRQVERIHPPAILDGGDVMMADQHFFIGISKRTNPEGAAQLGHILERCGFTWQTVPVASGLHLKSSVNYVGNGTLLITSVFAGRAEFKAYQKILIEEDETYASNTLWINGTLLTPRGFPNSLAKLQKLGLPIIELEMSEARKMDGGLSCMSLRF
jgi:dimethylargininase